MKKKLLVTVGNEMMGDDAAGPLLAEKIQCAPLEGWEVLNGGSAPENLLFRIREIAPNLILIVDATDMDLEPGEIRRIKPEEINDPFLLTTHTLPLTFLIQSLNEFVAHVEMVGIQPDVVAFGYPISGRVEHAVDRIYSDLKQDSWNWDHLEKTPRNSVVKE
jgi:hydrogenase 3 maturation protease